MGQSVNVVERPSSRPGVVRFETNRVLSGMGHDRYTSDRPVEGNRPVDEIARRLFDHGGVAAIHVNSNVITVDLDKGATSAGLADIIRDLYRYYPDTPAPSGQPELPDEEAAPDMAGDAVVEAAPADSPGGVVEEMAEVAEEREEVEEAVEAEAEADASPPVPDEAAAAPAADPPPDA